MKLKLIKRLINVPCKHGKSVSRVFSKICTARQDQVQQPEQAGQGSAAVDPGQQLRQSHPGDLHRVSYTLL